MQVYSEELSFTSLFFVYARPWQFFNVLVSDWLDRMGYSMIGSSLYTYFPKSMEVYKISIYKTTPFNRLLPNFHQASWSVLHVKMCIFALIQVKTNSSRESYEQAKKPTACNCSFFFGIFVNFRKYLFSSVKEVSINEPCSTKISFLLAPQNLIKKIIFLEQNRIKPLLLRFPKLLSSTKTYIFLIKTT